MTLLTPLGLLGLLGIAVLILIYIIKPNYQQKLISTTFVWKLSLKYRKRRIPISKLRNFLIILCQILILTSAAVILAQPNQIIKAQVDQREVIVIIDASASMRTEKDEVSRFERAKDKADELIADVFKDDGYVSVIIADDQPDFLLKQRMTSEDELDLQSEMDALIEGDTACSYGTVDLNQAIAMCEEIVVDNPKARIYVYTDNSYEQGAIPAGIEVISKDIAVMGEEWNAAIIDVHTEYESNYYTFVVEVACYGGRDKEVEVTLNVSNANAIDRNDPEGMDIVLTGLVDCSEEKVKTLAFVNEELYAEDPDRFDRGYDAFVLIGESDRIATFEQIHVSIAEDDSFALDNNFDVYNGLKEVVRVQYASAKPNPFFGGILASIRQNSKSKWDMKVTEVKQGTDPAVEGFDFYIFEHSMPEEIPTDGVVFLVNPTSIAGGAEIKIGKEYDFGKNTAALYEENAHPILNNVVADRLEINKYVKIDYSGSYQTLLSCDTTPVLSIIDEPDRKVIVLAVDLHYSNLPVRFKDYSILLKNMFDYFFPPVVDDFAYEVNQKFTVTGRGGDAYVTGYEMNNTYTNEQLPATVSVKYPGAYTVTLSSPFGAGEIVEKVFVRVPKDESNIFAYGEMIESPFVTIDLTKYFKDLLVFIAGAMVAIIFIEWLLSSARDAV